MRRLGVLLGALPLLFMLGCPSEAQKPATAPDSKAATSEPAADGKAPAEGAAVETMATLAVSGMS